MQHMAVSSDVCGCNWFVLCNYRDVEWLLEIGTPIKETVRSTGNVFPEIKT